MKRDDIAPDRFAMTMTPYANAHASGVRAYESSPRAIKVQFADGTVYVYTHDSTGRARVERMKRLAREGKGLATFISRHVQQAYASRHSPRDGRA